MIEEKLRSIIAESLGIDKESVTNDLKNIVTDSLDNLDLMWRIETAFDISLDDVEIHILSDLQKLTSCVEAKTNMSV